MTGHPAATTWWACAVVHPKHRPEIRLATAIELARMRGIPTDTVHVSPAAAAETKAPPGVTIVAGGSVPANQFRFARKDP